MKDIVNLAVTAQTFNTIMAGLEELPHKMSRGVIDELVRQVKEQTEQKPAEVPADAAPDEAKQD